jgi:uncharacterized protein with von Willebrand factor type A (vWA) domain
VNEELQREAAPEGGRFAVNIMHFARALRVAGLPVGPGKVIEALRAVEAVGIGSRRDFYWTLHAVFVNRRDQRELFDQAFHIFWRKPDLLEKMMQMLLPGIETGEEPSAREAARRVAEALGPEKLPGEGEAPEDAKEPTVELDASLSFSEREILQRKDFEQMSAEEVASAKTLIQTMRLPIKEVPPDASTSSRAAAGSICARRSGARCAAVGGSSISHESAGSDATRRSSSCAMSRARWSAIRACCSTSCTR